MDFDDQSDTEIADRAKTSADSVAPVTGLRGELVFRACDFGEGAAGITVEAAGEGTVELSLGDGPVLAVLTLSPVAAVPYDYATVSAPSSWRPVCTTSASDCVARCDSRASP